MRALTQSRAAACRNVTRAVPERTRGLRPDSTPCRSGLAPMAFVSPEQRPLHEHPPSPEVLGDLALRVGLDGFEAAPQIQPMGVSHEVGAVEPESGVSSLAGRRDQAVEQRRSGPGPAVRRLDVHGSMWGRSAGNAAMRTSWTGSVKVGLR